MSFEGLDVDPNTMWGALVIIIGAVLAFLKFYSSRRRNKTPVTEDDYYIQHELQKKDIIQLQKDLKELEKKVTAIDAEKDALANEVSIMKGKLEVMLK